jgi:hypothetical protein
MKKKLVLFLFVFLTPLYLLAQNTIGKSKDEIRNIIQSNPNFKLLPGDNCDTLKFAQGMQSVFFYKDNMCYRSTSILPLAYMNDVIEKMTTDSYKKINQNVWVDSKETMKVEIKVDKNKKLCVVETTAFDKAVKNPN